jgi:hypothetical protein
VTVFPQGSLTLTTTHLIFEPASAQLQQQQQQDAAGDSSDGGGGGGSGSSGRRRRSSEPTSPTKRTSLPLAEVARAERFSGRLTKLDNALRLEMLNSESVSENGICFHAVSATTDHFAKTGSGGKNRENSFVKRVVFSGDLPGGAEEG